MQRWQCRIAPSLGALEGTPQEVWGTPEYNPETDQDKPCVWFGLYGLPDFYALWRHKGRKAILFAGSDIIHLNNGYWLDEEGKIRLPHLGGSIAEWINVYCESFCENEVERRMLEKMGIEAEVRPSFMGNVNDYEVSYQQSDRPKVYASVSGDNYGSYGWHIIERIASKAPDVDFYLFGGYRPTNNPNVFTMGRVPKEKMNKAIQSMQCGLRLNSVDGFSEIVAKSVLWGQYPIVRREFAYPYLDAFYTEEELVKLLRGLREKKEPNLEAREYYIKHINQYPWNKK